MPCWLQSRVAKCDEVMHHEEKAWAASNLRVRVARGPHVVGGRTRVLDRAALLLSFRVLLSAVCVLKKMVDTHSDSAQAKTKAK